MPRRSSRQTAAPAREQSESRTTRRSLRAQKPPSPEREHEDEPESPASTGKSAPPKAAASPAPKGRGRRGQAGSGDSTSPKTTASPRGGKGRGRGRAKKATKEVSDEEEEQEGEHEAEEEEEPVPEETEPVPEETEPVPEETRASSRPRRARKPVIPPPEESEDEDEEEEVKPAPKAKRSPARAAPSKSPKGRRGRPRAEEKVLNEDEDEDDYVPEKAKSPKKATTPTRSSKRARTTPKKQDQEGEDESPRRRSSRGAAKKAEEKIRTEVEAEEEEEDDAEEAMETEDTADKSETVEEVTEEIDATKATKEDGKGTKRKLAEVEEETKEVSPKKQKTEEAGVSPKKQKTEEVDVQQEKEESKDEDMDEDTEKATPVKSTDDTESSKLEDTDKESPEETPTKESSKKEQINEPEKPEKSPDQEDKKPEKETEEETQASEEETSQINTTGDTEPQVTEPVSETEEESKHEDEVAAGSEEPEQTAESEQKVDSSESIKEQTPVKEVPDDEDEPMEEVEPQKTKAEPKEELEPQKTEDISDEDQVMESEQPTEAAPSSPQEPVPVAQEPEISETPTVPAQAEVVSSATDIVNTNTEEKKADYQDPAEAEATENAMETSEDKPLCQDEQTDPAKDYVVVNMEDVPAIDSSEVSQSIPSVTVTPPEQSCAVDSSDQACQNTESSVTPTADCTSSQEPVTNSVSSPTKHSDDNDCNNIVSSPNNINNQKSDIVVPNSNPVKSQDPLLCRRFISNPAIDIKSIDEDSQFTLLSYNVLADCHAQRANYGGISAEHLSIEYRHRRIMEEIRHTDADIICLQEVSTDHYQRLLQPQLEKYGYKGSYIKRPDAYYDEGEATFVRTSRFIVEQVELLDLSSIAKRDIASSGLDETTQEALSKSVTSPGVAVLTKLTCEYTGNVIAVCNVHIMWEWFKRMDIQCIQAAAAIRELVTLAGGADQPHVICGDFNSWPGSPAHQLTQEGYLNDTSMATLQEVQEVKYTDGRVCPMVNLWWKGFQHTSSNLKSANATVLGQEPKTSKFPHNGEVLSVDYVWFASGSLDAVGVLETSPESDIQQGIPSAIYPSDHVSTKVTLAFKE